MLVLAYNDSSSLPGLVRVLSSVLESCSSEYEIVVVDDGSSDQTVGTIEQLRQEIPHLHLVRHPQNRGVGAAFRSGVMASKGDIVGYIDGDGQYDPCDIASLLVTLDVADAVSGLRQQRADPLSRKLISLVYNWIIRWLFRVPLRDVNSGLKLFRRHFLEVAFPLQSDGPFFDAEVLTKGIAAGHRVLEVPVTHSPRLHGRASGGSLGSICFTLSELCSRRIQEGIRQVKKTSRC